MGGDVLGEGSDEGDELLGSGTGKRVGGGQVKCRRKARQLMCCCIS